MMELGEVDFIWVMFDCLLLVFFKFKDQNLCVIVQVSWLNGVDVIIICNGIKSLVELKGKKVIYFYDFLVFIFLKYVFKEVGMDIFDIVY